MYITFLIAVLVVGLIIFFVVIIQEKKRGGFRLNRNLNKVVVQQKWQHVEDSLHKGDVQSANHSVMEADKIFEHVANIFSNSENKGLGDRLKHIEKRFSNYDIYQGVWQAHKLRNRIVHDMHAEIPILESKRAVEKFKKGLKDLKVL